MAGFKDQLKTVKRNTRENKIAFFIKTLLHLYGFLSSPEEKELLIRFCAVIIMSPILIVKNF